MLGFIKKFVSACALIALFLVTECTLANCPAKKLDVKFINTPLDLSAIIKLRSNMSISPNPKKLSVDPKVTCFQANIDEYLPNKTAANKKIWGCIFADQPTMNASLLRAGFFVHTGTGLATDEQLFNSKLMTAVGGHDFNGEDLVKYYQNAKIPEITASEHSKYKAIEQQFKTQVIDYIMQKNSSDFIFFAVINTKKFKANLTHELLHAQYYNVPQISPILLKIWQTQVPAQDQTTIIESLQNGGYDMKQQELLLREFYSYFLQYDARKYLRSINVLAAMSPLANVYAPIITKSLNQENIRILEIKAYPN